LAHRIAARTGVSFPEQAAKAKLNLDNRRGAAMALSAPLLARHTERLRG